MVNDPIADLLVRIKNSGLAHKTEVRVPYSRVKEAILNVISGAGFVGEFQISGNNGKKELIVKLKYDANSDHVVREIRRISTPGCRIYIASSEIRKRMRGKNRLGIISTSRGVISNRQALQQNLGGELLAIIW